MNFLIIPENKAENPFMLLDGTIFSIFKLIFIITFFLVTYKFSLLKIAWRINEWRMFY